MSALLLICLAYLLGSVPFGLLLSRAFCHIDPRAAGSRNVGATNVARLCGTKLGVLTLALDALKGFVPVSIAAGFSDSPTLLSLTALAAVLGHVFPVFMNFKGGKAVATTIGVFLPLAFWQLLIAAAVCVGAIWLSGFVSVGSLALVTLMPILCLVTGKAGFVPLCLAIMAVVYWRHRENIARLARGEEKPWRGKKENAATAEPQQREEKDEKPE